MTPVPFITPDDERAAQSKSPKVIGQMKLIALANTVNIGMTDDQIADICSRMKLLRDTYMLWENFYNDLAQRKARLIAFMAIMQLDVDEIATGLNTTVPAVTAFMTLRAQAEQKRIGELTALWLSGQLPDRPVLTEPLPNPAVPVSPVSSPDTPEPTEPTGGGEDTPVDIPEGE